MATNCQSLSTNLERFKYRITIKSFLYIIVLPIILMKRKRGFDSYLKTILMIIALNQGNFKIEIILNTYSDSVEFC